MKAIVLVPARGGSQGVPRKNVRLLNHKPLILYTLETIKSLNSDYEIDTYVMTDDNEIEFISKQAGFKVIKEKKTTGKATLDDVTLNFLESLDYMPSDDTLFITIQPTCPFVKKDTIKKALNTLKEKQGSILTVKDDRHLAWTIDDNGTPQKLYKARLNRQELPPNYKESGAVIGSTVELIRKNKTRINEPINLIPVDKEEGIDIDDFYDWSMAEYVATRKKIIIRADASKTLGMGHVYRSLSLAQELAQHNVVFYTDKDSTLAQNFFAKFPFKQESGDQKEFYKFCESFGPDIVFVDLLDTEKDFIQSLKKLSKKVVTFEDLGEGAMEADLLISDLYRNNKVGSEKQLSGINNAILAPSFDILKPKTKSPQQVENILVLFGGTDPSNLTEKTLNALESLQYKGKVTVIQGMGKDQQIQADKYNLNLNLLKDVDYMPQYMIEADLAISSAGRTITELISLGIPTLCMCQNKKEITHTHASQQYGVLNIGLGSILTPDTIAQHIQFLLENSDLRQTMTERANSHNKKRSNKAIVEKVLEKLEEI